MFATRSPTAWGLRALPRECAQVARSATAPLNIPTQAAGQVRTAFLGAATDLRLVVDAGVFDAIDAFRGAAAAEAELARGRVADRPFAHVRAQGHDRGRARQVRDRGGRGRRRDRLGRDGFQAARSRSLGRLGRGRGRSGRTRAGGAEAGRGARRLRRSGPARQAQTVHLADHGVAGDPAAQLFGDLARGLALEPELLQRAYAVVGPACGHATLSEFGFNI